MLRLVNQTWSFFYTHYHGEHTFTFNLFNIYLKAFILYIQHVLPVQMSMHLLHNILEAG